MIGNIQPIAISEALPLDTKISSLLLGIIRDPWSSSKVKDLQVLGESLSYAGRHREFVATIDAIYPNHFKQNFALFRMYVNAAIAINSPDAPKLAQELIPLARDLAKRHPGILPYFRLDREALRIAARAFDQAAKSAQQQAKALAKDLLLEGADDVASKILAG